MYIGLSLRVTLVPELVTDPGLLYDQNKYDVDNQRKVIQDRYKLEIHSYVYK